MRFEHCHYQGNSTLSCYNIYHFYNIFLNNNYIIIVHQLHIQGNLVNMNKKNKLIQKFINIFLYKHN